MELIITIKYVKWTVVWRVSQRKSVELVVMCKKGLGIYLRSTIEVEELIV